MQHFQNNYNHNLVDFFKQKSHSLKTNASCEKTLPIKSPILNNFLGRNPSKLKTSEKKLKYNEKTKTILLKSYENCPFCSSLKFRLKCYLMISSALQIKHTPNLHYHVTKNINDILQSKRTSKVISYKDMILYNEEQECLKRFYNTAELPSRLGNLTEFYQYHNEIPNLHIYSLRKVLKCYHSKKRKLEYILVRKLLGFKVNKDILESSYEQKEKEDDSSENNKKKVFITQILKDISVAKEQINSKPLLEERKFSITFHEFSYLNINDEKNPEVKDLAIILQKFTENSFEAYKPELLNKTLKNTTAPTLNFKKLSNLHQRFPSNLIIDKTNNKSNEKLTQQKIVPDKKILTKKSITDRNYDFKVTKRTIKITGTQQNNTGHILSPKSPIPRIKSDRNGRTTKEILIKSSSISIPNKKPVILSAKIKEGFSLPREDSGKNKMILKKKSKEKEYDSKSHLRFFSMNGCEASANNSSYKREGMKSPSGIAAIKSLKMNNANILFNKKFVESQLEELLFKKGGSQKKNSLGYEVYKKNNMELLKGKNTQNLFQKIYENDLKSPNKLKP